MIRSNDLKFWELLSKVGQWGSADRVLGLLAALHATYWPYAALICNLTLGITGGSAN